MCICKVWNKLTTFGCFSCCKIKYILYVNGKCRSMAMITVGVAEALATVALTLLVYFIISYKWKRRHLMKLAALLPGLPALPIFGNILEFQGSPEGKNNKMN